MVKRLFDLFSSLSGLIILSPLFVIVELLIKLDSSGSVFHRGRRIGKDGRPFYIYKFRTMVADASKRGPAITTIDDQRITGVGSFLRKTKIDELPQLINVVKAEMSLVGPRPEDPRYVELYTPEQRRVLKVRPGITSAASFAYRHEEQILSESDLEKTYCTEVLPAKLKIDLDYLSRRTLFSDLILILRTIISLFH
jgi:lipopolysaccharide/colanic/teichoic acid biosynthesis glycosyltransferase